MLSLENLNCFVQGARLLNFRQAARAVFLTPAALGTRIQQLEDQLGTKLFHRTTRRVVLTQEGLAFLPHAHRALLAAQECERAGRGEVGPLPIEVTLGTRHELGMSWVVPMLPRLQEAHPGLTPHLYFGSSTDLLIRVRSVEIDCAVGSMRVTDPKLDSVRLHAEDYVLVGQPRMLKGNPLREPTDALKHRLVDISADLPLFGYWRDAPRGGDRLHFKSVLKMGTASAVRELVLRGEGVAVLPHYMVKGDLRAKKLAVILPEVKPLADYFRLIFRTDDPRRSIYESIARTMLKMPLR